MKNLLLLPVIFLVSYSAFSQGIGIGTNTPDSSAVLDISHSGKGLLIPRMSLSAINSILNPAKGLMVYDSAANQLMVNMGTTVEPDWQPIVASANGWSLTGNSSINPTQQFIGTTDNLVLRFRVNNIQAGELHPATGNISWGLRAGQNNTTGFSNIAIGSDALKSNTNRARIVAIGDSALFNNGTGAVFTDEAAFNTAIGSKTLFSNTIGGRNTATGFESLYSNTTGSVNTAYGGKTLFSNTSGRFNTANGYASLFSNTNGESNTASGYSSLYSNSTGHDNTASGFESLVSNTTGSTNTASGSQSLYSNSTGSDNTAVGNASLRSNTAGNNNVSIGSLSLFTNTTGSNNTATGVQSLYSNSTGSFNVAYGRNALFTNTLGSHNTAIGNESLFSNLEGNGNTAIGDQSLRANITGDYNTTVGHRSLLSNTTGMSNTALGTDALVFNTTGSDNTAIGTGTLAGNLNGYYNTGIGSEALFFNSSGSGNTAGGYQALNRNTVGGSNIAFGLQSMAYNSTGNSNVAVGNYALTLSDADENTAIGYRAGGLFLLGAGNTLVGNNADVTQHGITNSVALGQNARCTADDQVRLGNTFTTSIGGIVGFTNLSDGRFKKNIQEAVVGIDFIMKLRPVTYQLDIAGLNRKLNIKSSGQNEENKTIQSGFIAQEVEQAAKDAGYNFNGVDKPRSEDGFYGLRYAEFVVPLVKAMQEQQQMINELKKQNDELQKRVLVLEKK